MSDIGPISPSGAPALDRTGRPRNLADKAPPTGRRSDSVELSLVARLRSRLADVPDVRQDLIDHVKAQIAAGTYDTPEKFDQALNEMLSESG